MQRDGDAAAAAAASYRVLSRLLGYGTGPEAGAAGGAGAGAGAAGPGGGGGGGRLPGAGPALRSPRPQLMVFRNAAAEGRPGEDCGPVAAAAAAGGGVPGGGGAELCPRHRCALEPKAAAGWGAAAQSGLELQLAALGLRPPGLGAKGAAGAAGTPCPCLGPPAGEETSDALLVLEALEPDEGGSGSEDEPGSPGRGAARAAGRAAAPGAAPPPAGTGTGTGGRKGSLRIRLSRLFRTKSCSGGSATGDAASAAASAGSLTDVCGARGREQEPGRKHRLTRTQSAFSPVVFSPLFTGETVSLVDVDISQRGLSSPHPPTPPPPPRRSLSLLDDFSGTFSGNFCGNSSGNSSGTLQPPPVPGGSSLQSFPLPPPPPPHAPESLSRAVSLRPPEAPAQPPLPPPQCPLARPDPGSFAASLRELEKSGNRGIPRDRVWESPFRREIGVYRTPPPAGKFPLWNSGALHAGIPAVRVVLGPDDVGGRGDEADREAGRILPGAGQLRPALHPEPELPLPGNHAPHPHGALPRDVQPLVPPQVRGSLPVRGGVHQEGDHAFQEREIPLLPALPRARPPSDAGAAPVSRLQVQQRQIPAAPLPLPHPAARAHRPHPRAAPAHAPDLLHPQVLLLRPAGGAVPVPQGGPAQLPARAAAGILHVAEPGRE